MTADETGVTVNRRWAAAAGVAAGVLVALVVVRCGGGAPPGPGPRPAAITAPGAAPVAALRLMPLGDSITYGLGSSDLSGYRVDLADDLARDGIAVTFVGSRSSGPPGPARAHEGHPGWNIAELTGPVAGWLAAFRPDVVLLHIGTNDLGTDATARGAPARLARLLDRIVRARPAAQIFVAELIGSGRGARQHRIDVFNAAVARLVAAAPPNVHLVDQTGVDGRLLRDGLHPDDAGYAAMAATWAAAIARVVPAPATGPSRTAA